MNEDLQPPYDGIPMPEQYRSVAFEDLPPGIQQRALRGNASDRIRRQPPVPPEQPPT